MDHKPEIVIEGLEEIIERDLEKHKNLLSRSKIELDSYKKAVSYQIQKKKHYKSLIGNGKYNDESLRNSMAMIAIDIRQLSDKVKLTQEAIEHHSLIIGTLSKQLENQYESLKSLKKFRENINGNAN